MAELFGGRVHVHAIRLLLLLLALILASAHVMLEMLIYITYQYFKHDDSGCYCGLHSVSVVRCLKYKKKSLQLSRRLGSERQDRGAFVLNIYIYMEHCIYVHWSTVLCVTNAKHNQNSHQLTHNKDSNSEHY